jgi:hypothetical protein
MRCKRLVAWLVAGCYLYSQENRPTDMSGFRLYYNLNKHAPDQDSTWAVSTLWADAANGPLTRVNICGIVSIDVLYY